MNTKEAIEKVQNLYTYWINYLDLNDSEIIKTEKEEKEIINLLQQGEAYKKIVWEINNERLFQEYDSVYTIPSNIYKDIHKTIKKIIEKYFPKE